MPATGDPTEASGDSGVSGDPGALADQGARGIGGLADGARVATEARFVEASVA